MLLSMFFCQLLFAATPESEMFRIDRATTTVNFYGAPDIHSTMLEKLRGMINVLTSSLEKLQERPSLGVNQQQYSNQVSELLSCITQVQTALEATSNLLSNSLAESLIELSPNVKNLTHADKWTSCETDYIRNDFVTLFNELRLECARWRSFRDNDELPVFFVTAPIFLIMGLGISYFCYGRLPHEAVMRFWGELCTTYYGLFAHLLPALGKITSMFFAWLFPGLFPQQQGGVPSPLVPPDTSNFSSFNMSHFEHPAPGQHPLHRSMAVQGGGDALSPEAVLGLLVNNTQFWQAMLILLSSQSSPLLSSGCSAAAANAMRALQQTIPKVANDVVCNLHLLGKKIVGNCTSLLKPRSVDPSSGITCAGAGALPPPGSIIIELAKNYFWFHHHPLPESVTSPLTPSLELASSRTKSPSFSEEFTESASDKTDTVTKKTRSKSLIPDQAQKALRIFWAQFQTGVIGSATINGTTLGNQTILFTGNNSFSTKPSGIQLSNGRLYWGDYNGGGLLTADPINPDNPTALQNVHKIINSGQIYGLFIDAVNQKIYNSGWAYPLSVANFDSSIPSVAPTNTTVLSSLYTPGIAVDRLNGKIYWMDWGCRCLFVGDINPQNPTTSFTSPRRISTTPLAYFLFDFPRSQIYWRTQGASSKIYRGTMNLKSPSAPTDATLVLSDDNNSMGDEGGFDILFLS